MRFRDLSLVLALAAPLALARAAAAGDTPDDVKEAIAYFDKYAGKAKDETKYAELVHDLASTQHAAAASQPVRESPVSFAPRSD